MIATFPRANFSEEKVFRAGGIFTSQPASRPRVLRILLV